MSYKSYKKEYPYTYILGPFPTIEALESRPDLFKEIIVSDDYTEKAALESMAIEHKIPITFDNKTINRLSRKGNTYVIGVINKEVQKLSDSNHIILHQPSNMGNLGTIIRTMVGLGYKDLAMIGDGVDYNDPRVIRASMGSIFKISIEEFETIEDYLSIYGQRDIFSFILSSKDQAYLDQVESRGKFSLIFGSEGPGLPQYFEDIGRSVKIPQSQEVDSLNLTIASSLAMYHFADLGALKE